MQPRSTLLSILIIAGQLCGFRSASAADEIARLDYGRPRALLIAYRDYPNFPQPLHQLEHPLPAAIELARQLERNGYEVLLITESGALKWSQEQFEPGRRVAIEACDSSESLRQRIMEWGRQHFEEKPGLAVEQRAPAGLLVFCGHGEREADDDLFLTPSDRPGTGGVSLRELSVSAANRRFPVAIVFDACRPFRVTPQKTAPAGQQPSFWSSPKQKDLEAFTRAARQASAVQLSQRTMVLRKPSERTLILYATSPGGECRDLEWNLTRCLAEGLEHTDEPSSFVAIERSQHSIADNFLAPRAYSEDLCLLTWFHYALNNAGKGRQQNQRGGAERGWIDQSMIIASRRRDFQFVPPPVDLLAGWDLSSFPPRTGFAPQHHANGIAMTRQTLPAGTVAFGVGFFEGKYDLRQKLLYVEVFAPSSSTKPRVLPISFSLGDNQGAIYNSESNDVHRIASNRRQAFLISFDQAPAETSVLALRVSTGQSDAAEWPVNSKVIVTRLTLLDEKDRARFATGPGLGAMPDNPTVETIDLLPSWWACDPLPLSNAAHVDGRIRLDEEDRLCATIQRIGAESNQSIGWGGPIFPELPVHRLTHNVAFVVESCDRETCRLVFRMVGFHPDTGAEIPVFTKELDLQPNDIGKRKEFLIDAGGVIDYLGISTNANHLKLSSLRIVPRQKPKTK